MTKALKIIRRPNWQKHIQENAYQAEALSDHMIQAIGLIKNKY